jgi:metal-responsive CopG/Arc/MetJ family transcriptional regulator
MANDLKNRERFTTTVDIALLKELRELSKETMIPISRLINKALINLLREYGKSFETIE